MSRLKELTSYKNTIIDRICGNDDLLKAVYYTDEDYLSKDSVNVEDVLFRNIYPFDYTPSSDELLAVRSTYITLSITDYNKGGNGGFFNAGSIFVRVFAHKDLLKTAYPMLRVDYLISEIDELLNGQPGIGMGKLEFIGAKEFILNENYYGMYLHYRPVDFS